MFYLIIISINLQWYCHAGYWWWNGPTLEETWQERSYHQGNYIKSHVGTLVYFLQNCWCSCLLWLWWENIYSRLNVYKKLTFLLLALRAMVSHRFSYISWAAMFLISEVYIFYWRHCLSLEYVHLYMWFFFLEDKAKKEGMCDILKIGCKLCLCLSTLAVEHPLRYLGDVSLQLKVSQFKLWWTFLFKPDFKLQIISSQI